jgi:hypothetical protein
VRRGHLLAALLGAIVATVVAGGVAWATIPPVPGGVIQGCYDAGGNVKVVEALPCPPKYTPFQWNQRGPAGTNGTNGTDGTDGTNGTDGTDGINGTDGTDGINGTDGTDGTNGVSGYEILTFSQTITENTLPGTLEAVCPDGKVPLLYQLRGQTGRVIGDPFADLAQRKVSVSYNGGVPGFTLTFHLDLSCATMG